MAVVYSDILMGAEDIYRNVNHKGQERSFVDVKGNPADGQLKLALTLLYFMTKFARPVTPSYVVTKPPIVPNFVSMEFGQVNPRTGRVMAPNGVVVYVGSSPGRNIITVAKMFPGWQWILIDPADSQIRAEDTDSLKLNETLVNILKECATEEMMSRIREEVTLIVGRDIPIYFVSDIRLRSYTRVEGKVTYAAEDTVRTDTDLQTKLVQALRPSAWMLKIRMPYAPYVMPCERSSDGIYTPEQLEYESEKNTITLPVGKFLIQPYAREASAEYRLIGELVGNGSVKLQTVFCEPFNRFMNWYNQERRPPSLFTRSVSDFRHHLSALNEEKISKAVPGGVSTADFAIMMNYMKLTAVSLRESRGFRNRDLTPFFHEVITMFFDNITTSKQASERRPRMIRR